MSGTELYHEVRQTLLQSGIPQGEASALAFMLLEETTRLSRTQLLTSDLPTDVDTAAISQMAQTIAQGTPIQYVLGYARFCDLQLRVNPSVLIPRPETEELVRWALETTPKPLSILDIGTGSGCIAIALAKALPQASVTAIDISPDALAVAQENAAANRVSIQFRQFDILSSPLSGLAAGFDLIISNPPYICQKEKSDMEPNVLNHEPHLALFVPDDDPLLFYRTIAQKALTLLSPHGTLLFEINRQYASDLRYLLLSLGYSGITLRHDQFGNPRMLRAKLPPKSS